MRTVTSDRNAAESWLIPIECDWDKGKNKEQKEKGNKSNCRKWGHKDARDWYGKKKQVNRARRRSSSSFMRVATDTPIHRYTDIDTDVNTK